MANKNQKSKGEHLAADMDKIKNRTAGDLADSHSNDGDAAYADEAFELDFSGIDSIMQEDWSVEVPESSPKNESIGLDADDGGFETDEYETPLDDYELTRGSGAVESRAARRERLENEENENRHRKNSREPRPPKATKEPKPPKEKSESGLQTKIVLIVVSSVLLLLIISALVCGYLISVSDKNLPNIHAGEIAIGGLTREETLRLLEENNWDESVDKALVVRLTGNVFFRLDMRKAGVKFSAEQIADRAQNYGHAANWLADLANYIACSISPVDIAAKSIRVNDAYIDARVAKGVEKFHNSSIDEPFRVDLDNCCIVMVKGAGDVRIDEAELAQIIKTALLADEREVNYGELKGELKMPDFEGEFEKLDVEPVSAYYDTATSEVVDDISGYSFDVDEAKRIWNEAEPLERIVIDLERIEPEVTGEALRAMLFRDTLGEQVTYFTSSSDNRINNISLACTKISGLILNPGETFSYNAALGQRTQEAGFLEAGAYDDGQVVQEIGGGICQVSSTLYCAVMFSRLKIAERTNHYFKVDYLPYGNDATVSWPKPDFKFTNDQQYPIKIIAYTDNDAKSLTIRILGTNLDGGYAGIRHESFRVYDEEYPEVWIGYSVLVYRIYYDANNVVIHEEQAFPYPDIYYFHDDQIAWPAEKNMTDEEKAAAAAGTEGTGSATDEPTEPSAPTDGGSSDGSDIQPDL